MQEPIRVEYHWHADEFLKAMNWHLSSIGRSRNRQAVWLLVMTVIGGRFVVPPELRGFGAAVLTFSIWAAYPLAHTGVSLIDETGLETTTATTFWSGLTPSHQTSCLRDHSSHSGEPDRVCPEPSDRMARERMPICHPVL
jgi:hypothetical protein